MRTPHIGTRFACPVVPVLQAGAPGIADRTRDYRWTSPNFWHSPSRTRRPTSHMSAGLPPMIRVHGDVRRINLPPMEHEDVHAMVYDIMSDAQRKNYEENLECDFSFAVPNLARFRVNAFVQSRGAAAAFRTIPSKVLSLEELERAQGLRRDGEPAARAHPRAPVRPVRGSRRRSRRWSTRSMPTCTGTS